MKNITLAAGLVLTSVAFADVDYTRCNQAGFSMSGVSIDNDGKVQPQDYMEITGVVTNGKEETYTLKSKPYQNMMGSYETKITILRDDNGNVIGTKTGGEKPDQQTIEMWKKNFSQGSFGFSGGFGSGSGSSFGEPVFNIDGKHTPLSKVTSEEAKASGFGQSLEQYRKLSTQRRRDKKTLAAMKEAMKKINEKANYVIPFGTESEFDIKDGVCMLKSLSSRQYSTKTKEVSSEIISSREGCEEITKLYKKYEPRLNECQDLSHSLNKEYYENFLSKKKNHFGGYMMGGYAGGMAGGYMAGGYAGGMAGGYMAGGYVGGFNSSPYVGAISGELWSCEYNYGVGQIQGGLVGGSQSGSQSGTQSKQ